MKLNLFVNSLLMVALLTSCQLESKHESEATSPQLVDAKYSVAKDRTELDTLRQNIPLETKKQNDEKALIAELMNEVKYAPEVVREKFSNIIRKKRELFNKDLQKSRDAYTKNEKKSRDEFLSQLSNERAEFLKQKTESDKRAAFFNEQDETRRNYFSEQREARDEFEAESRNQRKNFDDYIKEKTDDFNSEYKEYLVKWKDQQTSLNQK